MKFSIFSCDNCSLYTTEGGENLSYGENLGIAVEKAIKDNVSLKYADLRGSVFEEAGFEEKNFDYVNLDGAIFYNSEFYGCSFKDSSFKGVTIECSNFSFSNFYGSDMSGITMNDSDLRNSSFIKAILSGGRFDDTKINSTDFRDSDLTGVWFKTANFIDDIYRENKTDFNIYFENSDRINTAKRNCRASFAEVLDVIGADEGLSFYDENIIYKRERVVRADKFDLDWKNDETHGIHFFLTEEEAKNYEINKNKL